MRPGLGDPVLDSQRIFRAVMDAFAHPGRVIEVAGPATPPRPLHQAAAAFCLTMVDFETPLWLDAAAATSEARDFLRFHCGCQVVEQPEAARFAVIADPGAMPAFDRFDAGTDEFPDSSATLVIQSRALSARGSRRLTGPGIAGGGGLAEVGVTEAFWEGLASNDAMLPRGVDQLRTDGPGRGRRRR